jgi:hypothetical protein
MRNTAVIVIFASLTILAGCDPEEHDRRERAITACLVELARDGITVDRSDASVTSHGAGGYGVYWYNSASNAASRLTQTKSSAGCQVDGDGRAKRDVTM